MSQILKQSINMNKNIITKSQLKTLKSIPWVGRSDNEIWKINRQIIYSKSTRTFYPKIKFISKIISCTFIISS